MWLRVHSMLPCNRKNLSCSASDIQIANPDATNRCQADGLLAEPVTGKSDTEDSDCHAAYPG